MSSNETLKEVKKLRSDCSTGADHIPEKFPRIVTSLLASSLTHIINTCIDTSTFPKDWKVGRISLMPNKDQLRAVSILPDKVRKGWIETDNFLR